MLFISDGVSTFGSSFFGSFNHDLDKVQRTNLQCNWFNIEILYDYQKCELYY